MNAFPARPSPTAAPMAPSPKGQAECDECSSELNTVVCHEFLLMMFVFETLTGRAEVDDRQQHEDERLDEADEDDVERLPDDEEDGPNHRSADCADNR